MTPFSCVTNRCHSNLGSKILNTEYGHNSTALPIICPHLIREREGDITKQYYTLTALLASTVMTCHTYHTTHIVMLPTKCLMISTILKNGQTHTPHACVVGCSHLAMHCNYEQLLTQEHTRILLCLCNKLLTFCHALRL